MTERGRGWLLRWAGWLVWLVALPAQAVHGPDPDVIQSPAQPPQQEYTQVWHLHVPFGSIRQGPKVDPGTVVPLSAPADPTWALVDLPRFEGRDPIRARAPNRGLEADWYRVDYPVPAGATGPLALYLPRAVGAAVQVLRFDGRHWRMVSDGADRWREQWNVPILVDLGEAAAAGGTIVVAVGLIHYEGGETRVAPIRVGPRAELSSSAQWRQVLQHVAPQVGSLTFLSLGLFALMFWRGRRREQAYLLFFLSSLVWGLRNLHYYTTMPTGTEAYIWFWWMTNTSLSWVMVLVYLFALRFDPRRSPKLERGLVIFVAVMSVVGMPFEWTPLNTVVQQHVINAIAGLAVVGRLSWMAWTGGTREFRLIVATLWVTEIFGVHDLLLVSGVVSAESIYLLPFASLLLFLAFLFAVQTRYSQAISHVEQANERLERRLAEREAQLHANHERISGIEREQALLLERQRLMRDMHDGLGSTLMSSLVLVEQGKLDSQAVAELLRECVDDLRLVIDSLEPMGQDLVTLLASLRHRLGRRLEGAGLKMHWDVEDLPPLEWLQPHDTLQVMRIVQEVLTNVLKHARAATVRLATRAHHDSVTVLIEDDGAGFDPTQEGRGRGVRHLYQRASRLGGRIILDSAQGQGTRVRLELPLQRKPAA
ncbi:MAG: sensor histidine kinase [Burkholderiales bacterium]|nr:sensor histidine kinase [Burkholderiales bacterium]